MKEEYGGMVLWWFYNKHEEVENCDLHGCGEKSSMDVIVVV